MIMNILRLDPSRTLTLRRQFIVDVKRRLTSAEREIIASISPSSWQIKTTAQKVLEVERIAKDALSKNLLAYDQIGNDIWAVKYINTAYDKGAQRAYRNVKGVLDLIDESGLLIGAKNQFINDLKDRNFESIDLMVNKWKMGIEAINSGITSSLVKETTDWLRQQGSITELTKEFDKIFEKAFIARAVVLSKDQIIEAHAEGQLDAFEGLGIEQVGLQAEWMTADDEKVCPACMDHEGDLLTIEEARGFIPLHPGCRCIWVAV